MATIVTVGFCGAGNIVHSNHLPNLEKRSDRYRVAGFFDIRPERSAERAADKYIVYDTYEQLLADADIDLVVVATKPLGTHYPTAKQALEAGKHVLLEKPMAASVCECDDLIATAQRNGVLFTVHHNRRLDLDFLALMDVLERRKIGEPRFVANMVAGGGYGGGDFVDWGVHLVDQALQTNASPIVEVSAFFANPVGGCEDGGFGEATLRFEKPPVVRVAMLPRPTEFLGNGTPARTRFYAVGTTGTFLQRVIEDPRDLMNATQNFDNWRPEYAVPGYLQILRREYYDYLYDSLVNEEPPAVSPVSARNAIRVIELMTESARANRAVPATHMR